jgi:hypothetical protein
MKHSQRKANDDEIRQRYSDTTMPPPAPKNATRSRRRTNQLRVVLLTAGLLVATCTAEVALQLAPSLLPTSFRERFPPHGIEFFHRGLLDRTKLQEVPLPFGIDAWHGPPPSDLVDIGIAPPRAAALDQRSTPRIVVPADADGMPNSAAMSSPDAVFVGDSFTVFAAQLEPPGLQRRVELAFDKQILNLSVSGLGPDRENFLLQRLGLPKKPKLVVWFFFGGNDITDALWMTVHEGLGVKTYGQLLQDRRAPRLLLPSLIASWFTANANAPLVRQPLAALRTEAQPSLELWLHPDVLRVISVPEPLIAANPGWLRTTTAIRAAHAASKASGAEFLLVYLPCKAQVYLPILKHNPELLHSYASESKLVAIPMASDSAQFAADAVLHRNSIEKLIAAFCNEEHIRYWSARPSLDQAASKGEQLYYSADTHWNTRGQEVVADDLIPHLRSEGLLK